MRVTYIPVGQIVNAHGIRGEVKLNPAMGFDPEFLAEFDTLYIDGKATKVKSARVHKSTVLLTLPGVEDMDAALAFKGKSVSVLRDDVEMDEDEYFDTELEGLTVLDSETDAQIGKIKRVLNYPAHKIYEVKGGGKEYLIPAVKGVFIESVDLDGGMMRVHMMKGLASDEN
ncbi:MAG: ribosome maturation factor RimM [Eubacteriales bacterium]|nr:ribosome maturation factor RimM [Eubacteriales bacterium]